MTFIWVYLLPSLKMMKLSDFIIIYLACGAPFGVFFLLQNRLSRNPTIIYLKSISLFFVWIPYAIWLMHDFVTKRFQPSGNVKSIVNRFDFLEKQISQIIFDSGADISLFEFREIFERYTGLTLAKNSADKIPPKSSEEIFRVALRENTQLGAKCLHRRNRLRIELHQSSARKDFLVFVSELNRSTTETEKLRILAIELTDLLNDKLATEDLQKVFTQNLQSEPENSVNQTEEMLWKTGKHKQSFANKIPRGLRALTALRKD